MTIFAQFIDFFINLDQYLGSAIEAFGPFTYGLLFLIIFLETGLVVTPILPGDSLLFAAGSFAAIGALNVGWLLMLLSLAAIAGDTANYWIGRFFGNRVMAANSRLIKPEYLERSKKFYEKHGAKTIVIARFVPIVRTFAPFLAGVSRMDYGKFIIYNIAGGMSWVSIFVLGGFLFGNLPIVRNNFSLVIFIIIAMSLVPVMVDHIRKRR